MTINKTIELTDRLKPNAFSPEIKAGWLSELDGTVAREVLDITPPVFAFPEDMDKPLLIPHPFEDVYILYLSAMIDLHNRDYADYNNLSKAFNSRLDQFKKDYIRHNIPPHPGFFSNQGGDA